MKKLLTLSLALSVLSCSPQAIQQAADNLKTSSSPSASVSPTPQANASVSPKRAITEAQVKNDKMIPDEDDTIVVDLENKDVTSEEDDTGTPGEDIIPVNYTRDISVNIKWEGDKDGTYAELKDANGNVIYKIEQGGDTITKDIPKGEYTIELTSNKATVKDGPTEQILFMRLQDNLQVSTNWLHYWWVWNNNCEDCDLSWRSYKNADFKGKKLTLSDFNNADLTKCNLTGANLQGGKLGNANFTDANLSNVNLRLARQDEFPKLRVMNNNVYTNLRYANLTRANLSGSDLRGTIFSSANLTGANLSNVTIGATDLMMLPSYIGRYDSTAVTDFHSADLTGANFTGANIGAVNFTDAKLSGAIWTDGRKCAEGSIGECK